MWLFYSLSTVALWGTWGMLGKIALRTANWVQASLFFGLGTVLLCAVLFAIGGRRSTWSVGDMWVPALTGLVGAAGVITFYLALERGKASVIIPIIGLYPILAAVLSVVVLGEHLTPVQAAGVALAAVAVILLGMGG